MENVFSASVKDKLSVEFKHLPAFATHILHHELNDFVTEVTRLYEAIEVPVFRFVKAMDADKRHAVILASNREMLTLISSGNIEHFVLQTINNWRSNQIPQLTREQIHSQDITLVNYVKSRAFRNLIPRFTDDVKLAAEIVEEIDRLTVILNSELFSVFIEVQNQEISNINTVLKKREQQLLEAQKMGRVGSFEWDLQGQQSSYTPQVFEIFEIDGPGELTAFLDDLHPEEREKVRKALDKAFVDGDYECEYRYVKNDREKFILSRGKVVFDEGKPVKMLGTVTDVTERHTIIEKLKESENLHKQAQALTHIGNWSWDLSEQKIRWSDEMYRIFGLEPQSETITLERFLTFVHPEDKDTILKKTRRLLHRQRLPEYHFKIISAKGFVKVLQAKGEIHAGHDNKPLTILGTCQDITREFMLTKQLREREKYLEELNQSLQLANEELSRTNDELESFNFIASHDLQEPLRKIQVYSNRILDSGVDLSPELQDYFNRINTASKRMQKLIEDFLAFSQTFKTTQRSERVDMAKLLEGIKLELGTRIAEKQARIEVAALPPLYGSPFQIKQLMTNLISNALKYSHADVPPHIVITGGIEKGSEIPVAGADPRISYSTVSVADNGIGFEAKYVTKIFELFQRLHTKNTYSGTGIGLALCKKIVQNMKGFITADSTPGKGSVFTIYLPVSEA
ncbi:MAG: PAS domain-containing protein [Chryseosolibacter sp.]